MILHGRRDAARHKRDSRRPGDECRGMASVDAARPTGETGRGCVAAVMDGMVDGHSITVHLRSSSNVKKDEICR